MVEPLRVFQSPAGTVHIFESAPMASRWAADQVAAAVQARQGKAVLGLATGGSPIRVYQRLVELYREGVVSFRDVTTFNLDEYYPISPLDKQSYRFYMHEHLFSHVDLSPNRAHVLDGTVPESFTARHAEDFDGWVRDAGGIDLQLLGIGRNGHIGFNEPSSLGAQEALRLPSRLTELHPVTIADAARDFGGDEAAVPRRALTMGTAPILAARAILVLAFGANKAEAVRLALHGSPRADCPASLLQTVADRVTWVLDEEAAD